MHKTFEEWWEEYHDRYDNKHTIEICRKAWADGYDAGILKALELSKQNSKKLVEAYGGL
jgi:hypothetical protein